MKIQFHKYHGAGNDFILLDNRINKYNGLSLAQISFLCNRHFGIGADGLMLLSLAQNYDFRMTYFNSDGNESSMCGNGGRCITAFARDLNLLSEQAHFIAIDGTHESYILDDNTIRLRMQDVNGITHAETYMQLNTGSPHYVHFTQEIQAMDMKQEGALIRFSPKYKDEGINVNFVEVINSNSIFVRTYERGVEDETLSCGTGVTAASLCFIKDFLGKQKVNIKTLGGNLLVECVNHNGQEFTDIWLTGSAVHVFSGEIEI